MNEQKKKEFDILYLKEQIKFCENGIKQGNWKKYPDSLEHRKKRLKRLNKQLKNFYLTSCFSYSQFLG